MQDGDTPLHLAARNGHFVTLNYLLKKGANYTIKNKVCIKWSGFSNFFINSCCNAQNCQIIQRGEVAVDILQAKNQLLLLKLNFPRAQVKMHKYMNACIIIPLM